MKQVRIRKDTRFKALIWIIAIQFEISYLKLLIGNPHHTETEVSVIRSILFVNRFDFVLK